METNKKEVIKKALFIFILIILTIIVGFITIKYEIEGEKKLPFNLTKIRIISTADGIQNEEENIELIQVNDIYLTFEKNEEYKNEELIRRIRIENIKISKMPQKGNIVFYRPSNEGSTTYSYNKDFLIEKGLEYFGDAQTDLKTLSISNQGGTISFRSCLRELGIIDEEEQEKENEKTIGKNHDATLLKSSQIDINDIKYEIEFDIIIELETGMKYKANANLKLPNTEIGDEKVNAIEQTQLEDIVFKRMRF